MRFEKIVASMRLTLPSLTMWIGRTGLLLGPILGVMNLVAISVIPPYSLHELSSWDAVQFTGYLLTAPAVQYLILIGFVVCLLWVMLWIVRMGLAACSWIISRRAA